MLDGNPAGEASVKTGRCCALDEPVTRAYYILLMSFPPAALAADAREVLYRRVGLSVAIAEGAWQARFWVSAGVVRGTVMDAMGGSHSGRGG